MTMVEVMKIVAEKWVFEEQSYEEAAAAGDGEEQKGVVPVVVETVEGLDKEESEGGDKGMCQWVEGKKKKV